MPQMCNKTMEGTVLIPVTGKGRPCVGLTPQPRSPTKCLWIEKSIKEGQGPIRTVEAS